MKYYRAEDCLNRLREGLPLWAYFFNAQGNEIQQWVPFGITLCVVYHPDLFDNSIGFFVLKILWALGLFGICIA